MSCHVACGFTGPLTSCFLGGWLAFIPTPFFFIQSSVWLSCLTLSCLAIGQMALLLTNESNSYSQCTEDHPTAGAYHAISYEMLARVRPIRLWIWLSWEATLKLWARVCHNHVRMHPQIHPNWVEKCVSVFVWGCIDIKETGVRRYARCSPWWWLRVGGRVRGSPLITKATQMMLYAGERTSGNHATSKESIGILVPCLESDLTPSMFNNLSISEGFWNYNLVKGHRQLRQTERGLIRSFTTYKLYELLNVVCFSFSASFWRYQLYQSAWLQ